MIHDFEMNRTVVEKSVSTKGRVDLIASTTIKYYDSFLSRIAICCRGDPTIYTYTYNHSFAIINLEATINLNKNNAQPGEYPLDIIPSEIKFSNDTYYMYVIDYSGGIRIYKFFDVPKSGVVGELSGEGGSGVPGAQGSGAQSSGTGTGTAKVPTKQVSSSAVPKVKGDKTDKNQQEKKTDDYLLVYQSKYSKVENFTPFNIKKQEDVKDPKDKKDKKKEEKPAPKKGDKVPVTDKPISEDNYNVKAVIEEETNNDFSALNKHNVNKPFVQLIQRKLIFEEKIGGGFASSLVTVGAYITYANTTSLKFLSFYNYLTDNMKNSFKVVKTRGIASMAQDESMILNAGLPKGEREFLSFLKQKIEQVNQTPVQGSTGGGLPTTTNPSASNLLENQEKTEVNFSLLYTVSVMALQHKFNNNVNYLGIGMTEGSILVWDVELHCEKYFFQENNAAILNLTINNNFLTSGSLDGKVNIYNLSNGTMIFTCYHNGYMNYPIISVSKTTIILLLGASSSLV